MKEKNRMPRVNEELLFILSFRLARNLAENLVVKIFHSWISSSDKLYFVLSTHTLYLLLPDNGATAVLCIFIIHKPMEKVLCGETERIDVVLVFMDPADQIIRHSYIKSRPRISHNVDIKTFTHFQPIYQKDSGQAGMTSITIT